MSANHNHNHNHNHKHTPAFVGFSIGDKVIFNIVEREGEFDYTGMSIIHSLKRNKNKFVSKIFQSQSYETIKEVFDDKIVFGKFSTTENMNMEAFQRVYDMMVNNNDGYFYIYNAMEDILIVKTPDIQEPIGLNYRNSSDIRNFINKLKDGG